MRTTLYISLCALVGLLTSCVGQYNIAGNSSVACLDGRTLYLRVPIDRTTQPMTIDSCEVIHGRFSLGGEVDSITVAQLYMGARAVMPVVIENGDLTVVVDNVQQRVAGGKLNDCLYAFLDKRSGIEEDIYQLEQKSLRMMREGRSLDDIRERVTPKIKSLAAKIEKMETKFIKDNFHNALGPGYFIMLCDQQPLPIITAQMREVLEDAPASFFANPYIRHYLNMAAFNPMSVGVEEPAKPSKRHTKNRRRRKQ